MTSFGIEWDTNALVYNLPPGTREKEPILEGDKWTITLESQHFKKTRDGVKSGDNLITDCGYNIEVQIGVFTSDNETQFNSKEIMRGCFNFNKAVWEPIHKTKSLTVGEKNYQVVSYRIGKVTEQRYVDCGLTEPGHLYDTNNAEWGYVASLNNVVGKTQYTIGLKLKYYVNLFRRYVELVKQCKADKSKCETIAKFTNIEDIVEAYYNTYEYFDEFKLSEDNDELLSCIMLFKYFLLVLRRPKPKTYFKAMFHMKLRSNLAGIFNLLSTENREAFSEWVLYTINHDDIHKSTVFGVNKNRIVKWFSNITNPVKEKYYTVEGLKGVSKYEVFVVTEEVKKHDEIKLTEVKYANLYSQKAKLAVVKGNVVKIERLDEQEWTTGPDKTVYVEFRSPETVISLLDKEIAGEYTRKSRLDSNGAYTASRLTVMTSQFVQMFLNKIFLE